MRGGRRGVVKKGKPSGAGAIAKAGNEYRSGDYEAAILTLGQATVDEDEYVDLAYLLGLSYARLGRFDEALLYLEQVVTQSVPDRRVDQCRMTLAYVYAVTGRAKLAEYELKKLLEADKKSPRVFSALGHASWKQGRLDDGIEWYAKALELEPENPTALNGYGYLLACADRDLQKALTCCRKALDADPGNPAYADSIGWTYLRLGMLAEAGRFLGQAVAELDDEEIREHLETYEKAVGSR